MKIVIESGLEMLFVHDIFSTLEGYCEGMVAVEDTLILTESRHDSVFNKFTRNPEKITTYTYFNQMYIPHNSRVVYIRPSGFDEVLP